MCDTCEAEAIIKATRKHGAYQWDGRGWNEPSRKERTMMVQGEIIGRTARRGGVAESRARFRFQRRDGRWSTWQTIDALANAAGLYGLDTKWRYVPLAFRRWLKGTGQFPMIEDLRAVNDRQIARYDRQFNGRRGRIVNGVFVRRYRKRGKRRTS